MDDTLYAEKCFKKAYSQSGDAVRAKVIEALWSRLRSLALEPPDWLTLQRAWLDPIYRKYSETGVHVASVVTTREDVRVAVESAKRAVADGRLDEVLLPLTTAFQGFVHEAGRELGLPVTHSPHSDLRKILDFAKSELGLAGWDKETANVVNAMQVAVESIMKGRGEGDKLTHAQRGRPRLEKATYRLFVNATSTLVEFVGDIQEAYRARKSS